MFGYTALIRASANGRTAAVKLLLAAGADKDAKNGVRDCEIDTQRDRENERCNGGRAEGRTPTTRPRGQGATCAMPGVRAGVLREHLFFLIFLFIIFSFRALLTEELEKKTRAHQRWRL